LGVALIFILALILEFNNGGHKSPGGALFMLAEAVMCVQALI